MEAAGEDLTGTSAAQRADLAFRSLRAALLCGASQWVFVAGLIAVRRLLPVAVCIVVAAVGVMYSLGLVRYFDRRNRARVAQQAGSGIGKSIAGFERLPLSALLRFGVVVLPAGEIAILVLLAATRR
jgi:hypothetical protein